MNILSTVILFAAIKNSFSEMADIKEYSEKILNIYKNPSSSSTSKLLMYAFFYLDELFKLEEGIEEKKEECRVFLKKFYSEGGPQHIDNIPWGKFMEELKWTGSDVSEYENVINKTKRSWSDLKKAYNELPEYFE